MMELVFCCLLVLCGAVTPFPLPEDVELLPDKGLSLDALKFLRSFGYLGGSHGSGSESLHTEHAINQAILQMQEFGGIPATGVVDNATLKLMATPRCALPDSFNNISSSAVVPRRSKRYVIASEGWNKRDLTYFISNWSPKLGSQEAVAEEFRKAFALWSDYSRLRFHPVRDPNADIIIAFGRGYHGDQYPFDGPGNTLAHAFFPHEMDNYAGDIHFDEDEDWVIKSRDSNKNGMDFFTVATHEIGHSLGLSHSPVSGSVMFPYYQSANSDVRLHYDDILGMYQLYISRHIEEPSSTTAKSEENEPEEPEIDSREPSSTTRPTSTTARLTSATTSKHSTTRTPFTTTARTTQRPRTTTSPKSTTTEINNGGTSSTTTTPFHPNYEGDFETVDEHLEHDFKREKSRNASVCTGHFDDIAIIRGELFILKKKLIWRYHSPGKLMKGYPTPFRQMFPELPENNQQIDAVYERPTDGSIVLFTGRYFWVFDGSKFIEDSPKLLLDIGLPPSIREIDAAFVWGKNEKTYLFSRNLYWRYNETMQQFDEGYPQDISRWNGVPRDIDAAMTWKDGKTYFFKGEWYWRFSDRELTIEPGFPKEIGYWTGPQC